MKFLDKIKWRIGLYKGLIEKRNEIKDLYYSFNETEKKDFCSILKSSLTRSFNLYFLSKSPRPEYNFYSPKDNALVFKNYIFKSSRIDQGSQETIQEISFLIKEILIDKVYEEEEVRVEPGDIVFDRGANIGIFSVLAAKKAEIVYAFEPSKIEGGH